MRALATLLVGAAGLIAGCAGAPVDPGEPEEARLELGTGTWRFEPVEDGAELPMIHGAQGGWHVWVAIRTAGMDARVGSLVVELQPADESAPAQVTSLGVQLDPPDAEGRRSYLGWPAILPSPACSVGTMQRLRATFTSSSGERVSAERYLIAGPGDDPPGACTPP